MVILLYSLLTDVLLLLLLISSLSIDITKATSTNDEINHIKRADEYVMTSSTIDGIKRSNVCGDGYRIEGALLKSSPYSQHQSYLPYEDCTMTFKARRDDNQIRIRILSLDLNDIRGGVDCLDSLRFYQSVHVTRKDKLNIVDCGKVTEGERISIVSTTGVVTARFSTDGGNVSGQGFQVVLTAFRTPNKTHPCDPNNDEYYCQSGECISSQLLCDGVQHCLDGSDEPPRYSCISSLAEPLNIGQIQLTTTLPASKRQQWRGVVIVAFLLIILIVFVLFLIYFLCRRLIHPSVPLINGERKNYATILNSTRSPTNTTTQIVASTTTTTSKSGKRLDDDYNLL